MQASGQGTVRRKEWGSNSETEQEKAGSNSPGKAFALACIMGAYTTRNPIWPWPCQFSVTIFLLRLSFSFFSLEQLSWLLACLLPGWHGQGNLSCLFLWYVATCSPACAQLPPWSPTAASHQGRPLAGGSPPARNGVCSLLVTALLGKERKMWQICIIYNITLQFSKAMVSSLGKMGLSLLERLQDLPELSFIQGAQGFLPSGFLLMVGLEPLASACHQQRCRLLVPWAAAGVRLTDRPCRSPAAWFGTDSLKAPFPVTAVPTSKVPMGEQVGLLRGKIITVVTWESKSSLQNCGQTHWPPVQCSIPIAKVLWKQDLGSYETYYFWTIFLLVQR